MGLWKALLIMGLLCMLRRCDSSCRIGKEDVMGKCALQVKHVNGFDGCSSRVEVYHDDQWGTICDNWWDLRQAQEVCCGTAQAAKTGALFGEVLGQIWFDNVYCNGEESSLKDCAHRDYGVPDCSHSKDAGVICSKLQCDKFKGDSTQSLMWNSCTDLAEGKQSYGHVLLENITDLLESPGQLNNSDVTGLLQAVEDAVRLIGPQLQDNYTYIETNQTEVKLAVRKGKTPPTGPIHLSTHSAALDTDWQTATGNGMYPGFALAALVSYKNLEKSVNHSFEHLSGHQKDGVDPNYYQVYSKVVSVVVSNPSTELLDTPVSLTLRHLQEDREKNTSVSFICAYWKSGPRGQEGEEGAWATDGCTQQSTNSSHTMCVCEHLSSFAVLMARYPLEELFELQLLTKLGLVASFLCLAVCIFTFRFCPYIRSTPPALTRTTIHLHLCICLCIADVTFLAGISQTKHEVGCRLVAALLHYFFLGTFCWMLLEGVLCYRMVVKVFDAVIEPWYLLYTVGYGTPLVIVAISHGILNAMGIKGTGRHCWLPLDRGFMWSFNGPVVLILALNVFFFIITIWKLAQKFNAINPDLANLRKIKLFTITAVAQVCVLGLTWVFGMLLFTDGTGVAVVYVFTILNSPQGALIFIFHCLLSKKVRHWYIKKLSICTGQENHSSSQSQESRSPQTRGSIPLTQC